MTVDHLELCDPPGPLQYHLCPTRSATSYWNLDQHARTNLSTLLLLLAHTRTLFLILISSILDRVVKINTSSVVVSCLMILLQTSLAGTSLKKSSTDVRADLAPG